MLRRGYRSRTSPLVFVSSSTRGILDPSLRQLRAPIPPRVYHDMTRSCRGLWQSGVIKYMERI